MPDLVRLEQDIAMIFARLTCQLSLASLVRRLGKSWKLYQDRWKNMPSCMIMLAMPRSCHDHDKILETQAASCFILDRAIYESTLEKIQTENQKFLGVL